MFLLFFFQVYETLNFFQVRFNMHNLVYTHRSVKAVEYMVCILKTFSLNFFKIDATSFYLIYLTFHVVHESSLKSSSISPPYFFPFFSVVISIFLTLLVTFFPTFLSSFLSFFLSTSLCLLLGSIHL